MAEDTGAVETDGAQNEPEQEEEEPEPEEFKPSVVSITIHCCVNIVI